MTTMVAEAVVLELPVRYRPLTAEGCCYQDAVPRVGVMRWTRVPVQNGGGMALFHERDAAAIVERGWLTMNGRRATACYDDPACPHELVLQFADPWPDCHA